MSEAMTLRTLTLTEEEMRTVYVLIGAVLNKVAAKATDDELIAALTLRDRFKPEETEETP